MCGICGVISNGAPADKGMVLRMVGAMRHRGPDAQTVWADGQTALGHARLSIIDLAGGHQPMPNEDQSLWLTFNGEIFNYLELREELIAKGHRFATRSDTEVILHMYQEEGERCVEKFNGQWAFAIWDTRRRKLFLSRDRIGVRPLFYTQTADGFFFASEMKALLAAGQLSGSVDLDALQQILTFWTTLPSQTIFQKVQQLPPGHSMTVEDGRVHVYPYWDLTFPPPSEEAGGEGREGALAEELLHLMRDAVRIRLRSDVPVGSYLSGGLDSAIITALAKDLVGDRLRTFSVGFADAEFDETVFQQEASEFLHTQHSSIRCADTDIASSFAEVVWHAEHPILRTAPAPLFLLSRLVRDSGYKVVLTGEGADEMFGGYDIFKETKIRRFWAKYPESRFRSSLLRRLYPYMPGMQKQPVEYLRRFFHVASEDLSSPFFSHLPRWEMTSKIRGYLSSDASAAVGAYSPLKDMEATLPSKFGSWGSFRQAEYLEAKHLLPGYILSSQGDRMAMAHSVEGRYPFLDHRVVEFASKLSPALKMKVLDQKYLLKRAVGGMIPERIRTRYKQPYRAPDGKSFFRAPDGCLDMLSDDRVRNRGIFDPKAVSALVKKFASGRETSVKDNMAFVGILSTEILLDRFQSGQPAKKV
jgi:asparagine synthase (glutamine-hydrolysing)